MNGFIQFGGGLHVRGACHAPAWHSPRAHWNGRLALSVGYKNIRETDVPFAQDCKGDQFLLRDGSVCKLSAESGEINAMAGGLREFFAKVEHAPVDFLAMQPLVDFVETGGNMLPGQLLNAAPPFCLSLDGGVHRSLRAISAIEQLSFLADFSRQIADIPDGNQIRFVMRHEE